MHYLFELQMILQFLISDEFNYSDKLNNPDEFIKFTECKSEQRTMKKYLKYISKLLNNSADIQDYHTYFKYISKLSQNNIRQLSQKNNLNYIKDRIEKKNPTIENDVNGNEYLKYNKEYGDDYHLLDSIHEDEKLNSIQEEKKLNSIHEEEKLNSIHEEEKLNSIEEEKKLNSIEEEKKLNSIHEEEKLNSIHEEEKLNSIQEEEKFNSIQEEEKLNEDKISEKSSISEELPDYDVDVPYEDEDKHYKLSTNPPRLSRGTITPKPKFNPNIIR